MNSLVKRPLLTYFGGKWKLAPWIISFFPKHEIYVEPFGGAANVLLRKENSPIEIYNDLNNNILNIFKVLQDKNLAYELKRQLKFTPYSRVEYENAYKESSDLIESVKNTIIRSMQGFGSIGTFNKDKVGFSCAKTRNKARNWNIYKNNIDNIIKRMENIVLENKDALDIIKFYDGNDTLFYCDPPYTLDSIMMNANDIYNGYTLSDEKQENLCNVLNNLTGMCILSGYDNDIYNDILKGWKKEYINVKTQNNYRKEEILWLNPNISQKINSNSSSLKKLF